MTDIDKIESEADAKVTAAVGFAKRVWAFLVAHKGAALFAAGFVIGNIF